MIFRFILEQKLTQKSDTIPIPKLEEEKNSKRNPRKFNLKMLKGIKHITQRRIQKELKEMELDPPFGISGSPKDKKNINLWDCVLVGPEDTPYSGGIFQMFIKFPADYPFKPPKIRFKTKIYHCNISKEGNICLDILKKKWKPSITISGVLRGIQTLLRHPNCDDPLNLKAGNMFKRNEKKYKEIAREWTEKYAI